MVTRRARKQVWTPKQLRHFLNHVREDRLFAAWMLCATTGLRRGEILGLRRQDLALDEAEIRVVQTLIVIAGKVTFSTPKTEGSRRTVKLDPETVAALRAQLKRQAKAWMARGLGKPEPADLVFTDANGEPLNPGSVTKAFYRLSKRAGLPRIRLHDVRHSYATAALKAGVPAKVVSERLGHSTIGITLDTYTKVLPDVHEEAANRVASLILGASRDFGEQR